jgi:hypothetical protein
MKAPRFVGRVHIAFTPKEMLAALQDNKEGDARLLAKAMEGRFTFDVKRKQLFIFNDGRLEQDYGNIKSFGFASRVLPAAYGNEAIRQYDIATGPKEDEETRKTAFNLYKACYRRHYQLCTYSRLTSVLRLTRAILIRVCHERQIP